MRNRIELNSDKRVAERVGDEFCRLLRIFQSWRLKEIRPVYCPSCGLHYTMLKPGGVPWAPTVVHVICWDCGGDGKPSTLEAPR